MAVFEVELNEVSARAIERAIGSISGQKIIPAIMSAQRRAATAGRTLAAKRIREIYTIKAGDIKNRANIKVDMGGTETRIEIKGPFEPVKKYRARKNAHGIFVAIKRGKGGTVPRSFQRPDNDRFVARVGRDRGPLKGLYGPSVPQLFQNVEVMGEVQARMMEMYENRLMHELERRLGQ